MNYISIPGAPWDVLPSGIHLFTLKKFQKQFAYNDIRRAQFSGLIKALKSLKTAGCSKVYIDGSYVTEKPVPGDYDACWDVSGVNLKILDPVFLDFTMGRQAQKKAFEGEFFPSHVLADGKNTYLKFFQIEKNSGLAKGIVEIDLLNEDLDKF